MEFMRDQKVMNKKYLWILLLKVKEILKNLSTLVDVQVPRLLLSL